MDAKNMTTKKKKSIMAASAPRQDEKKALPKLIVCDLKPQKYVIVKRIKKYVCK
jgi:hypothetical protein